MSTEEKVVSEQEEAAKGEEKSAPEVEQKQMTGNPQAMLYARLVNRMGLLTFEEQQEVLDFIEALLEKHPNPPPKKPFLSSRGILAGLIDLDEEDFKELRREMWGNFPRDITE